jgi:hypothetical protein
MIRTQISLTEEQMARLRATALKRGVSIAQVIRDAVDTTVRGPDWEEKKRLAFAAIGSIRGDRANVSEDHDEYLAEIYSQ